MTDTYQWQRCDSAGANCADLPGETAAAHAYTAADVGHRMRIKGWRDTIFIGTSPATAIIAAAGSPLGTALPARMPESSGTGGTYYVDPAAGNDANNGATGTPWKTINHALATVPLTGSIIRVRPGSFTSSGFSQMPVNWNRLGNTSDPVTVEAVTPGTVEIRVSAGSGQSYGAWPRGTGLRLRGLVFRPLTAAGSSVPTSAIVIESASRIEVDGCTIYEAGEVACKVRGPQANGSTSDDIWFINCTFRPSGTNPFAQVTGCNFPKGTYYGSRGSHWLYAGQFGKDPGGAWDAINGCRRLVVTNCVFVGSTFGRDIELGPECRDGFIVGNTFYGNHAIDLYGNGDWTYAPAGFATHDGGAVAIQFFANTATAAYQTGNNVVKNNLFVDLDGHAAYGSGPTEGGNVVERNLCFNLRNGSDGTHTYQGRPSENFEPLYGTSVLFAVGPNEADADPLFTDPAHYDFVPAAGSPAAGAADPAYAYPTDHDGNARAAAPALGAYELA